MMIYYSTFLIKSLNQFSIKNMKAEHNFPYYISNSGVNTNSFKTGEIVWEKE